MANRFMFFRSYYEAISKLPENERLAFYNGLCEYAFNDVYPEYPAGSMSDLAYTSILPNVDASIQRAKNGKKGGRPSKNSG